MEDYPRTLADFEERFRSEEACRDYLFRVRWPEGFRCPRCGESRGWRLRSALWQARQCCAYGWLVGLPPPRQQRLPTSDHGLARPTPPFGIAAARPSGHLAVETLAAGHASRGRPSGTCG